MQRKKIRKFLIISLAIHALAFILAMYIVLPAPDRSDIAIDKLFADIIRIKPVIKEIAPPKTKEKEMEKPENRSEASVSLVPPKPEILSVPKTSAVYSQSRTTLIERAAARSVSPELKGLASPKTPLRSITHLADRNTVAIPKIKQDTESIAGKGNITGFHDSQVGPIVSRADAKGGSLYYVNAMLTANPQSNMSEFARILPDLARGILERATRNKIDIVFIIDTTGSMQDNVRGVKDYISYFLQPMEEKKIDVALGLVEFSDQELKKAKVFELTDEVKKFKKWLDKTKFYGGRDLPESGYEALIAALNEIKYRKSAQKFFVFMSDSPQHDLDYDGKSGYSLDAIVDILNKEDVSVDVVGLDYLPVKQLAWSTGGQWKNMPGGDLMIDLPESSVSRIHPAPGKLLQQNLLENKVTVEFDNYIPDWVELSYKILDPYGFKLIGTLTYRKEITNKSEKSVDFPLNIDMNEFKRPGIYTLIYKMKDSLGNQDILRQALQMR